METTTMGFYRFLGSKGHLSGSGFRVEGLGYRLLLFWGSGCNF